MKRADRIEPTDRAYIGPKFVPRITPTIESRNEREIEPRIKSRPELRMDPTESIL